jgi:hypothetical protein
MRILLSRAILAAMVAVMVGGTVALASGGVDVLPSSSQAATDVKGPCDEAEHANDARCNGAQVPEDRNEAPEQRGAEDKDHSAGSSHSGEMEPGDDDGGAAELESGDDNGGAAELESGDDSGSSSEMESGDDSGPPSNSGHGSNDHGTSGRDHPEDD